MSAVLLPELAHLDVEVVATVSYLESCLKTLDLAYKLAVSFPFGLQILFVLVVDLLHDTPEIISLVLQL